MRFSLKAMLMLVTALGLFLGYGQWRQKAILAECRRIETDYPVRINIPSGAVDKVWQRRPTTATITFDAVKDFRGGRVAHVTGVYSTVYLRETHQKLAEFGISDVQYLGEVKTPVYSGGLVRRLDVETLPIAEAKELEKQWKP